MTRATVETDASANLLATNPPTTLRAAVGAAAAAPAALAAALPVVLVTPVAALVEVVICLGIRSGKL